MSWSTMSRPTEDEPAPVPVRPGIILPCPSIYLSVSRSTAPLFLLASPRTRDMGQGAKQPPPKRVTVLAFRHKPPPAKARSEEMAPPSVETSGRGAGGCGLCGSKPHISTNPDEGFPRRASNAFGPGTTLLFLLPPLAHHLSVPNVVEHAKRSKSSRPPPDGEWCLYTDQGTLTQKESPCA